VPTAAELRIVIEAQDEASRVLVRLGQDVAGVERRVERAGGAFARLGGVVGGLGQLGLAGQGLRTIVDGAHSAFDAVGALVGQASDLNEQLSRSEQVFGAAAGTVQDFAKTTAQSLGISRAEALEAAGNFGALFRTAGLGEQAAADMSTSLVRLAADLASFNNIDPAEALEKLRSGLVGEAEPLRTVGVLLSEEAVKQKAVELGLAQGTKELTEAQKVQARYALILEQTGRQQGDFARTATGLANASRIIRASFRDIQTELGQALLPTVARFASLLAQNLPRALEAVQRVTEQLGPALTALFSGDLQGALDQVVALVGAVAAALAPQLAAWTRAFLDWVGEVVPPLLQALRDRLGDLWQWLREHAPPLLEQALAEWVPAFVRWVADVVPPLYQELDQLVAQLSVWIRDTGVPQMVAFGQELGAALVQGMRIALGIREGSDPVKDWLRTVLGIKPGSDPIAEALGLRVQNAAGPGAVSPEARLGALAGRVHVEIHGMDIVVGMNPEQAASEAGEQVRQQVLEALTTSQATTAPGASTSLQGSGR
jgi:hypothetical protein